MDLALKRERGDQERKDAKVLEILRLKDRELESLEERLAMAEQELQEVTLAF